MQNSEEIIRIIRTEVEERQAFLEKGLTLSSLAQRCGINRSYVSMAIQALGGFNAYIGRCRLAYLENWRAENPAASLSKAIHAAGFRSRQTYYNLLQQ